MYLSFQNYILKKLLTKNWYSDIIQLYRINNIIQIGGCMVSFENLELDNNSPIYMQIVTHIKRKIVSGEIENGDNMPSRRVVSALLGVNPNTIQKAYKLLEEENIIKSQSGAKSLITIDKKSIKVLKKELLSENLGSVITTMYEMGIEKDEAKGLFTSLWEDKYEK